jgi:hypothetical protein
VASTDIDGTNLIILGEGSTVALVLGDRTYTGTLSMRGQGSQESWFIKLTTFAPGEPDEIQIHKIAKEKAQDSE